MEIEVDLVPEHKRKEKPKDPVNLAFGSVYTDHMFIMEYSDEHWHSPRIQPYQSISLDPSALIFHYGQGIFEGMKGYRRGDKVFLFRPRDNFSRLNNSAKRMVMPQVDVDFCVEALKKLVRIDKDWIPQEPGTALYIRPTMIASEPKLGLRPSTEYLFYIILSPVGPYFKEGFNPVKIYVSDKYSRAAKGGVGFAKTLGNYAASLLAGEIAAKAGCSQVMWLDAVEHKYIEEAGTMNLFLLFEDELVTPPLTGTILPGITRDSVIQITRDWGMKVSERMVSIDEVIEGINNGRLKEIFGVGTAAVVAPVGSLLYKGNEYIINGNKTGDTAKRVLTELMGIQCGEIEDTRGWVIQVY